MAILLAHIVLVFPKNTIPQINHNKIIHFANPQIVWLDQYNLRLLPMQMPQQDPRIEVSTSDISKYHAQLVAGNNQ